MDNIDINKINISPKEGYIYLITNLKTNEKYVGQTCDSLEYRWKYHEYKAKKGKTQLICQSIRTYGKNNFTIELLEKVTSDNKLDDKLNELEMKYINELNTLVPNGLNVRRGGGFNRSNQTLQNMSDAQRIHILKDYEIPVNIRVLINVNNEVYGFRVDLPNQKIYSETDSSKTIQEKYDEIINIYKLLKECKDDQVLFENRKRTLYPNLPVYIYWEEYKKGRNPNRWRVKITNSKFYCEKIFSKSKKGGYPNKTFEELYEYANEWLLKVLNEEIIPEKKIKAYYDFYEELGYPDGLPDVLYFREKPPNKDGSVSGHITVRGHSEGEITFQDAKLPYKTIVMMGLRAYELYEKNKTLTRSQIKSKVKSEFK